MVRRSEGNPRTKIVDIYLDPHTRTQNSISVIGDTFYPD